MIVRSLPLAALCMTLAACAPGPDDVVAGDPERGRAIAEANCAECHRVSPDQKTVAYAGAPDFAQINSLDPRDWQPILHDMASTHIRVPLSPDWTGEKADVIAWIRSLEPQPLPEPEPGLVTEP